MKKDEVIIVPKNAELDKKLKQAIKTIDKKLSDLGVSAEAYKYKNPGNFKYNENDSNTINIQTSMDVGYLIKALAKMKRVSLEYESLCEELELSTYPACSWYGYSVDNWIDDLTVRIKLVTNASRINELHQSKAELNQFLSQEDRLQNTLDKISKILK
jgi:hypothetical protein